MISGDIKRKFFEFYTRQGHRLIPAAPLVLANDSTTLFTSSGMQPLVGYFLGEKHPSGKRLCNSQPCLRLGDIEEVGDNRHTTFFEMLGNWSLGDYFKKEQLAWFFEFLTKELGLAKEKLWVSVFSAEGGEGGRGVPSDEESLAIWRSLGVPQERIVSYGVKKNWWSRSGEPSLMPPGEIGGPDSEVFYEFDVVHDQKYGQACHPNCDCGRFMEIGNSVFIQYQKTEKGGLKELPQKNVDFGGGLERLASAANNEPDIFRTDLFLPLLRVLEKLSGKTYGQVLAIDQAMRVVADHVRASVMLSREGVFASNKTQGYVLRRLLRKSMLFGQRLGLGNADSYLNQLAGAVFSLYPEAFPENSDEREKVLLILLTEAAKFQKTLGVGLKELSRFGKLDAKTAFYLYESFGFPKEMTLEIARERGQSFNLSDFEAEKKKHQEVSRVAAAGMFKGGLADKSYEVTKLHTATHLLQWALRQVLGSSVRQEGSNITAQRLRFDFAHHSKLTPEQIQGVEELVNQKIKENDSVLFEATAKETALKSGALSYFREKYPENVKVYFIGDFSREICGGPHVRSTGELGVFKIVKEEGVAEGVRRIKAVLSSK